MGVIVKKKKRSGILFVHNNFPGQFGFIVQMAQREGIPCAAICSAEGAVLSGVQTLRWRLDRGTSPDIFVPATRAEADMLRGAAAARSAENLKRSNFDALAIVGHPGWGETLFLREVFPEAKLIVYAEFFYRADGADSGFDPEFEHSGKGDRLRIVGKNATLAMAYADADRIVVPTRFQASLLPRAFRSNATIVHEGVDLDVVRPRPDARLELDDGRILDRSVPVVTFASRCLEPLRGYHILMRALPRLHSEVADVHVVIVGDGGERGYGPQSPPDRPWKDIFLDEVRDRIDLSRVHFTGRIEHPRFLDALSISRAHVYYTYPFVLSWSLLEAMASECLIVASDTDPVKEVVRDGGNGILHNFFDHDRLAATLITACRDPEKFDALRTAARRTIVAKYDRRTQSEPAWRELIDFAALGSAMSYKAPTDTALKLSKQC